jgi:hypothetical protein
MLTFASLAAKALWPNETKSSVKREPATFNPDFIEENKLRCCMLTMRRAREIV